MESRYGVRSSDRWRELVMTGMLNGLRIADLSIVTAGAGTTQVLADFGADVIKIEGVAHPDLFRSWNSDPRGQSQDLVSAPFRTVNRNKRGLAIDLKQPAGRDVVLRLVATSDVVVENFRRGAIERLGLGFDDLIRVRPDIVLVSLSSQGATGPNVGFGSFGSTLDALGGIMSVTGYDANTPLWSSNKLNYPDQVVSLLAPALVLAAVLAARKEGVGRWIDVSQREVVTSLLGEWILMRSLGADDPVPTANSDAGTLAWCTPCAGNDDWVAISVMSDSDWQRCAAVVDHRPDASATGAARDSGLRDAVGQWSRSYSREDVFRTLEKGGVAVAPVMRGAELLEDPYFTEIGWFQHVPRPAGGTELQRGWAVRFDGSGPTAVARVAPHIGEHSEQVLIELGYDDHEIARLVADGVVRQSRASERV